jgi:thiamine biosynthesis protein ThiS
MGAEIHIIVNGFEEKVGEGATLSDLIAIHQEHDVDLIVEQNGRFVYPQQYSTTLVKEGDRIEFINPNFGG